jgi:diguanylate cyclase (GGDEF)-like protein
MQDDNTQPVDRKIFFQTLNNKIGLPQSPRIACLIIHINGLKNINSTMGYKYGDVILNTFISRLDDILNTEDVTARIGDSKFGVLLMNVMNSGHATLAANKILMMLEQPFRIDDQDMKIKVSMGIALYPEHASNTNQLVIRSEAALDQARLLRKHYSVYSKEQDHQQQYSIALENELEHAIQSDELIMHFQPQISLHDQQIHGMEALVRWNHPVHGRIPPDYFIRLAEQSELIVPLTLWTVNTSLRHCKPDANLNKPFKLSINLSAALLHDADLATLILEALQIWGVNPGNLVLEVTESAVMIDPEKSLDTLTELHEAGIAISIDDFGTGHSSLAYLKQLPVSELKIDKTFVINMNENKDDEKIVRSIIDLAHNFDMKVVAEGIETQHTLNALIDMDCDIGQGYYIARPMSKEKAQPWIMDKLGPYKVG